MACDKNRGNIHLERVEWPKIANPLAQEVIIIKWC